MLVKKICDRSGGFEPVFLLLMKLWNLAVIITKTTTTISTTKDKDKEQKMIENVCEQLMFPVMLCVNHHCKSVQGASEWR